MSHVDVHRIEAIARRRMGRTSQVDALVAFPARHHGHHWGLNRAPYHHALPPTGVPTDLQLRPDQLGEPGAGFPPGAEPGPPPAPRPQPRPALACAPRAETISYNVFHTFTATVGLYFVYGRHAVPYDFRVIGIRARKVAGPLEADGVNWNVMIRGDAFDGVQNALDGPMVLPHYNSAEESDPGASHIGPEFVVNAVTPKPGDENTYVNLNSNLYPAYSVPCVVFPDEWWAGAARFSVTIKVEEACLDTSFRTVTPRLTTALRVTPARAAAAPAAPRRSALTAAAVLSPIPNAAIQTAPAAVRRIMPDGGSPDVGLAYPGPISIGPLAAAYRGTTGSLTYPGPTATGQLLEVRTGLLPTAPAGSPAAPGLYQLAPAPRGGVTPALPRAGQIVIAPTGLEAVPFTGLFPRRFG